MTSRDLSGLVTAQLEADPAGIVGYRPSGEPMTVGALHDIVSAIEELLPADAQRVAIHAPACLESVAAMYACWQAKRTPVPVSTAHGRDELEKRARTARASALLSFDESGQPLVDEFDPGGEPNLVDDEVLVIFTSGTTGTPKGVVVSGAAMRSRLDPESFRRLPTEGRSATIVFHSMSHIAVPLNAVSQIHHGVPIVVPGRFTAPLCVNLVNRFDVRSVRLTPTMIYDLATLPEPVELGNLQLVGCGTANLPESTRQRFEERFGIPITHSYASTETIAVAIETEEDVRSGHRRPGSSGRVVPGVEIRLLDPLGEEVPPGQPGQLAVRSPTVFLGYLRDDGFEPLERDEWYVTSDLARVDNDGFLYILGRVDDVMVCGGFNIFPSRVEAAILEIEGVSDAVVAARDDDRLGQVPVAGVVAEPDVRLDPAVIREHLRSVLAAYEIPREIGIIDAVPRSPTSTKVDRAALLPLLGGLERADAETT